MVNLQAEGDGSGGTIRFRSARIGGTMMLSFATLTNDTGPAMIADGVAVGQDMSVTSSPRQAGAKTA
jgi:hypothetical protein